MSVDQKKFKRKLEGVVISDKNEKTITVNVVRRFKHKTYNKFVSFSKRYHAHDESNSAKVGDKVMIIESRPHSKLKKWELLSVQK
ncbi:30S ribosomal protein S17 [Halobacteriovorax sp. HLS]|uniref:30S ribosomal protein S17 n=1 Tax=Halobacteriovorax sp. HLS TaxID=2234000 RepID=UPI000FDC8EC4|nr:30S ribosomal protein S17 [Halobacteriovorax sp. HLS]